MPLFQVRELVQFPDNGQNASDTVISGVHFNRTALGYYNYTLYSNGTLSNGSDCWLVFDNYTPVNMLWNGTFINGTSCYSPIDGLRARGSAGIAFASFFAATILFSLVNLRKHGRRFLPVEKRWKPIGRRWQWYWMLIVAACGTISCFMSIDVDRDYLQSTAIILQSLFYFLMAPTLLAAVWEAVRHWGSWQERQICDRETSPFLADTSRERQEFWLPLIFYLFAFLEFFLIIPRPWTSIQQQGSLQQQNSEAKPAATDGRFKAGTILGALCIFIICYGLEHSMYRYKERPASRSKSSLFYLVSAPLKFVIVIVLTGIRLAFDVASSFQWSISPLKYDGNPGWIYGLGYTPVLLALIVFNIFGAMEPNEDKALIDQRADRTRSLDAELGIERGKQKPHWWRRTRPDYVAPGADSDPFARLKAITTEIGGGHPTHRNLERYVEMGNIRTNPDDFKEAEGQNESPSHVHQDPFTDAEVVGGMKGGDPGNGTQQRTTRLPSNADSQFTTSSGNSLTSQAKPQRVRSMLDI